MKKHDLKNQPELEEDMTEEEKERVFKMIDEGGPIYIEKVHLEREQGTETKSSKE